MLVMVLQYTPMNCGDIGGLVALPTNTGGLIYSAKEYANGMAHTNGIESVWAVMKRGYNGVYHNWSHKHLTKYIHEFTFLINSGNCTIDTIDRMITVVKGANSKRLTYKGLIR